MEFISNFKKLNKNVFLFLIINLFASFSMGIFIMFAGIYLKEIGYGEHFVGTILSVNTVAIALGSIISAYLIERVGRKNSFVIGFICIAVGGIFIVLVNNPLVIIIMAIINGFGLSIKMTAEGMYLTENTKEENRVFVFSINFIIANIGMMGASFLGGLASNMLSNYFSNITSIVYIFIGSSLLSLLSLISIYFMKEPENSDNRTLKDCLKGYINILNKKVATFMTYNFIIGVGAGLVVPFFSVYLKYSMDISDDIVGSILSISQIGCIIGGFIIPIMANKLGRIRSVIICQLLSIPFLLSIAFPQGIAIITLSFFMRNGLMNMAMPLIQNLSMEIVDEKERTNLSSFVSLSSNISRALGIYIGGFLMETFTYNTPYYFTVLFYIIGVVMFAFMYKREIKIEKQKVCV